MSQRLEPSDQTRIVTQLAEKIEELYVYPEAAGRIAAQLRARPATAQTPAEFATEIKQFLRGFDGHLSLSCRPDESAAHHPSRPKLSDPEYQRRCNYGFLRAGLAEERIGLLELTLIPDTDNSRALATAHAATSLVANTDALILDLRNVPGGWPSGGPVLLGHFLANEPVHLLTMTPRTGDPQRDWTPAPNPLGHRPETPAAHPRRPALRFSWRGLRILRPEPRARHGDRPADGRCREHRRLRAPRRPVHRIHPHRSPHRPTHRHQLGRRRRTPRCRSRFRRRTQHRAESGS